MSRRLTAHYGTNMDELFGLPAHPLLVHFPVVAIPALTILAVVAAIRPSFRQRFGIPIVLFGAVTAIATFLAAQSGEAILEDWSNKALAETHKSLGETLRILVLGLVTLLSVSVILGRREGIPEKDPRVLFTNLGVLVLAILSAIWTIRTGHEGAKLTWDFG